jgi:pimeloyl-ACP methyl ester carboxylesterase
MMNNKAETRELITLDADGILVRGTYHRATGPALDEASRPSKNPGVIFVNPLSTPRALIGDSAVYWATSFAGRGYPSFRFDLPGLGDSFGAVPNDLLSFINEGGYAAVTRSKVKEIVHRFSLPGAVVYGHCAGATSAIYAASECKECKGLIITNPYFNAANLLTPKLSPEMVDWARRSALGEVLRATYSRIREARKKAGNGPLPGNANLSVISSWKKVISSGIPILILKSPEPAALGSSKLRSRSFDYLEYIASLAVRRDQITIMTIETDHSFANRSGRAAVREQAESWLNKYFPVAPAAPLGQVQGLRVQEGRPVLVKPRVPAHVSSGDKKAAGD